MVKAINVNPDYTVYNFDPLVILPILDARKDKKVQYAFDAKLKNTIKRQFGKAKKYNLTFATSYGSHQTLNPDDIDGAGQQWIKSLGQNTGRYVLLLVVQDLQSRLTFGSVGSAELSGYLYDTQEGKLVWHHKGVGKAGQGGLLGMAMKGLMAISALQSAIHQLGRAFPAKGEAPVLK